MENIERSLVNFQDAEIGVAHFYPFDAPGREGEQRLKGFHKNEPDMHAGGVLSWGRSFSSSFHIYVDADCIDVNILYIKQTS